MTGLKMFRPFGVWNANFAALGYNHFTPLEIGM
jgi:hypothetical protein